MDKDSKTPNLICKYRSTVDYFISTVYKFSFIHFFDILVSNALYLDTQCPLNLSINMRKQLSNTARTNQNITSETKVKFWEEQKSSQFVENIRQYDVDEISQLLKDKKLGKCKC